MLDFYEFSYFRSRFDLACTIPVCLPGSSGTIYVKIYNRDLNYNIKKCRKIVIDVQHDNMCVINE